MISRQRAIENVSTSSRRRMKMAAVPKRIPAVMPSVNASLRVRLRVKAIFTVYLANSQVKAFIHCLIFLHIFKTMKGYHALTRIPNQVCCNNLLHILLCKPWVFMYFSSPVSYTHLTLPTKA